MSNDDRFQRTQGVLSPQAIRDLSTVHLLIAGVGGAGGQAAVDATRLGFGYLTLADFDVYERHNMNRQVGCFESTLGERKIDVVARMCRDINPNVKLRLVPDGITEQNAATLLEPSEFPPPAFVVEVIDLAGVPAKVWLHQACRDRRITIVTGLMLGFGGSFVAFGPDAPSYDQLFINPDGRINLTDIVPRTGYYFVKEYVDACVAGQGHAPTCAIGATTASSLMLSEILRGIQLGLEAMTTWPEYLYVDFFDHVYVRETLPSAMVRSVAPSGLTGTGRE
jgi:molybdopterin/thiamine biosynthesis adenylyltransferase